jgi:hypothetical protein
MAVEVSNELILMVGIAVSVFPGCCCDYVFDVSDSKISIQCLVVDKPWGIGDYSQSF